MPQEPELTIADDYAGMSRFAADAVAAAIAEHPAAAVAIPTGSTPLGMYEDLVARVQRGELDLSQAHFFCLDEYLGVGPDDPNSLTGWLLRVFLKPAGIDPSHIHMMPAADPDPIGGIHHYDEELAALGGLDLAVLGLGPNGHVAFNEPGSDADSPTRIVDLTAESRARNAGYWPGHAEVPAQAMTIGIAPLLQARWIVLIVSGNEKAEVLRQTLEGPIGPPVPASWLRLAAGRFSVITDRAAAHALGNLPKAGYPTGQAQSDRPRAR